MSPARERAVVALNKIFKKGKKPREVIDELSWDGDRRERSFLMELVYGVLRYRDFLDWMLKDFLKKPAGLSLDTIDNLRIAVYQISYMRVPVWAAVNEAVDVEKAQMGRDSLVNAVLRSFLREREKMTDRTFGDPVNEIAVPFSHPRWLIRRWIKRFGRDGAMRLAKKNNEMPPLTIRVDDPISRADAVSILAAKGVAARETVYSPSGIVIEGLHSFSDLDGLADFPIIVQDEAAQLISLLLDPAAGETVLDACAAPGGKTTHIAKLMSDRGRVIAVESEQRRISRLKENVARLGLRSVTVVHGDVCSAENDIRRALGNTASDGCRMFDRILLDAPCSALGVIRRNPDVKYRHRPQDLQRFSENQSLLIEAASRYLKAGGIMVYSVCSTEPEEGEEVIGKFLHANRNFSIIKSDHDFLRSFEYGDSGRVFYRTFPHEHDMDGFFAARLKRVG